MKNKDALSKREQEVLARIAEGKSNPQIAEELVISRSTVQNHVRSILRKTGASNRTEAAVRAIRDEQLSKDEQFRQRNKRK